MAIRPLVRYPDRRLGERCAPVATFDDELALFAADLLDTMRAAPGIGITSAHVGVLTRVVVIELPDDPAPRFYVNPEVVDSANETALHDEGSVSMPGIVAAVERPARVTVRYRTLDGTPAETKAEGLLAVCLQHEIDQLDGIFFLQRLSRLKRERAIKRWEKLARA